MRFKHIKKLIKEDVRQLDELKMSPSSLRKFATSDEADGIRAGFEAELIFQGLGGQSDDYDSEPDYDADERCYSINQIIDFFENDDYGNGLSSRASDRLRDGLDEAYMEWYDSRMFDDFRADAEDLIREVWLEDRPMVERIHSALTDGMGLTDDEADKIIAIGDAAPRFTKHEDQIDYKEENPGFDKYLEAVDIADSILDEEVEGSVSVQDSMWDQALENFRDSYSIDDDSGFFSDVGLRWMSDVRNEYDLDWPIWTEQGDSADGEYDYGNAEMLAKSLANELGVQTKAAGGYHSGRRDDKTWIFEPDSSLEADEPEDMPVEIVSPPMPLTDCLDKLEKFFKWAEENGAYANKSTGFHMGVSVPFKGGTVDYIKLALFLGDEYVLREFGRQGNHFAESAMKKIRAKLGSSHNKGQIADALDIMRNNLLELATKTLKIVGAEGFGKYTSINPHVDGDKGYIEFRSAGGREYMDDIKKLQNTLMRYAQAMHVASRPDLEREEYYKKLYKLISPQGSDALNLFAQYATGSIDKEGLKKAWAQEQLTKELGPEKKSNWKLYNKETGKPVSGAEFSNYTEEEAWSRAKSRYYTPAASMGEFKLNYELKDISTNTGRWSIIRRDNDETLEIVDTPTRGEAAEYANDKYTGVIDFYIQPYSGEKEPEPKLSPRAKLAKRITTPKDQATGKYEIVDRRTGEVVLKYRAADADDAGDGFNNWLRNQGMPIDTENYGYRPEQSVQDVPMDVAQNFQDPANYNGRWELLNPDGGLIRHVTGNLEDAENARRQVMFRYENPTDVRVRPAPLQATQSTSWRDQLAQTIQQSSQDVPRFDYEIYKHDTPDEVFHILRNVTPNEVRDYISNQERGGIAPGTLRVRNVG